jgi:hypothetical protein
LTDRINGFWITLEEDIRKEDAESVENALYYIKGVIRVTPNVSDINAQMAIDRVRHDLGMKIVKVIWPDK